MAATIASAHSSAPVSVHHASVPRSCVWIMGRPLVWLQSYLPARDHHASSHVWAAINGTPPPKTASDMPCLVDSMRIILSLPRSGIACQVGFKDNDLPGLYHR